MLRGRAGVDSFVPHNRQPASNAVLIHMRTNKHKYYVAIYIISYLEKRKYANFDLGQLLVYSQRLGNMPVSKFDVEDPFQYLTSLNSYHE